MISLTKLAQLAAEATKGPWFAHEIAWKNAWICDAKEMEICVFSYERSRDAEFMAAANPQVVKALVDEVRQLRKQVAQKMDHSRSCPYDINGSNPDSDFCTCKLAERRQQFLNDEIET